ncbi:MAG: peptide deformylase [Bacilli bacterium]|jgi:peptide deformylase
MLKDILDEKDKMLRVSSKEIVFPLSNKEKENIKNMLDYLINSQIEEIATKNNLRPGMGLAAIQLGIPKRYFVIAHEQEKGVFNKYIIINPKIISHAEELIYADGGEGCLSVNREVEGIVPRYARVTIEYFNQLGEKQTLRAREELAIAIQHEIDHLEGILFIDHIDKVNPYKDEEKMRPI